MTEVKISKAVAAKRAAKLRTQISELRYRYHVLDDPSVSDEVYDSLTKELRQLEEQFPELVTPDSPTQRIGGKPLTKFISVPHQTPMLSLNDAFNEDELKAWIERISKLLPSGYQPTYHIDLKMDGLAATVIYERGRLVRGLTRGDGRVGEDVTQNLRTIHTIPLTLRRAKSLPKQFYEGRVEARGEVILNKQDFARINQQQEEKGQKIFANPRNLAAGSVRQLNPKLTASRPLRFHVYALICDPPLPTLYDEYQTAHELGFVINTQHTVVKKFEDIQKFIKRWQDKRHGLAFQTDGLVIAINDREPFQKLGVVGKAPRGAIAFKYPAEQATTKLKDIQVSIGRTGAATPFAVMEPVQVAGSTIQLATLHNEDEIRRKDVRIGDTVIVRKAGDVIPEVVGPLPKLRSGKEKKFVMPKVCPVSGDKLVKAKAEEAIWRCPNKNCPARVQGGVIHFASKEALDIEGLGEKNVQALLKSGLIKDVADLYQLKTEDVTKLERFASKSAENLVAAIQAKKDLTLDRFLFSLGIRHVGRQTAIDLAQHFGTLERMRKAAMEEFEKVAGIGDVVAHSIYMWFHEDRNQKLLDRLSKIGVKAKPLHTGTKLTGKSFVITGTLDAMSREEAAEKIRALGGKFQNSVGEETDYLVVGKGGGETKAEDAKRYRTKQITESNLLKFLK